jgi:hypothetical protein
MRSSDSLETTVCNYEFLRKTPSASLNQASMNLLEILSDGTEFDEDDQSYIQSHLRLMELAYTIWKNGPIERSIKKADVRRAA